MKKPHYPRVHKRSLFPNKDGKVQSICGTYSSKFGLGMTVVKDENVTCRICKKILGIK